MIVRVNEDEEIKSITIVENAPWRADYLIPASAEVLFGPKLRSLLRFTVLLSVAAAAAECENLTDTPRSAPGLRPYASRGAFY